MSQEAAWITLFPRHLWDIDCAALDPCESELKCLHGHLHIIALPKSHSEFKGSSLEQRGTHSLLEEVGFR